MPLLYNDSDNKDYTRTTTTQILPEGEPDPGARMATDQTQPIFCSISFYPAGGPVDNSTGQDEQLSQRDPNQSKQSKIISLALWESNKNTSGAFGTRKSISRAQLGLEKTILLKYHYFIKILISH